MKVKTKKTKKFTWAEFVKFVRVNLWVEKFRLQALGYWFWVDTFKNIWERISPFISTYLTGIIINDLILLATSPTKDLSILYLPIAVQIVQNIFTSFVTTYYYTNNGPRGNMAFNAYLEQVVYKKLEELNWDHIENPKTEKNINQVFSRGIDRINSIARTHLDLVGVIGSFLMAFALIKMTWILLLAIVIQQIPSIIISFLNQRAFLHLDKKLMPVWQKSNMLSSSFRDFRTLYEIKVSGVMEYFRGLIQKLTSFNQGQYLATGHRYALISALDDIYETIIKYSIYLYYVGQVIFHGMQLGTFQYTTSSISRIGDNVYYLLTGFSSIASSYPYVLFVYDFLNIKNKREDGKLEFKGEKIAIKFDNVSFKYPRSKKYSLKNINITIEDNDRLALVGENGAGKTTFLKLLMLVHYPTSGTIYLNDIPLENYSKASLYNVIAVITQDFSRHIGLDVKQNISVYGRDAEPVIENVSRAADLAEAGTFIAKLPEKYDTFLTKKLDGGVELSTGQWQRIAISRQFYANRPLIILDEPTASIDPIAESKIFNNLYEHVKDKTVIVVSHRYNTVRAARKILVFKDGEIIEEGNHTELLAKDGYYAKAYAIQQEEKKL